MLRQEDIGNIPLRRVLYDIDNPKTVKIIGLLGLCFL